jgi:hypothetical protein
MSEELQAQDMAALAAEAAQVDAANNPAPVAENPEAAPAAPPVDRTAEVALLLGIIKPLAELAVPYVKGAPKDAWDALKDPLAELLNYYNVDVGDWLSNPWAKLAVAAMPLASHGLAKWQEEAAKPKVDTDPDGTNWKAAGYKSAEDQASDDALYKKIHSEPILAERA